MHAIHSTAPPARHGHRRPAVARSVAAATLALILPLAGWAPASAAPAVVFDYTITGGLVTPQDPACFNPFEGCAMDVTGVAVGTLSGAVSLAAEWDFQAVMELVPVSATEWSNRGSYSFMRRLETATDEPADLLGPFTGTFDINSFTATIDYGPVPGNGLLAGLQGSGRSAVTIIPGPNGNTFNEQGRFEFGEGASVPLPGTPALAAVALLLAATAQRRRPRSQGAPRGAAA